MYTLLSMESKSYGLSVKYSSGFIGYISSTNCVSEMVNSANVRTCRCSRGFLLADYWAE